ncbi:acetyltransferase spyB [Aspergillus thermomutatus]|uniref:Wax synthase domain-containing protein n=1 Tax=Aspergillus thermomutatus TaxID=41047 RepID=A0A397H0N2_ASPTH|nr:uncharacterized protein CDV56_105741 [Aspergillus thermomutatus]RHZ54853.1 hypothetical protein CDV56_105741 [Aspergillus thermomutatus]
MSGSERRVFETLLYAFPFLLAQNLVPAIVVLTTKKNSFLRYLWIFWSVFIFSRWLHIPISHDESATYTTKVGVQLFMVIIQGFNLVLINALDKNELLHTKVIEPRDHFLFNTFKVARLFMHLRGVRTPWQAKKIPSHPAYLARQPKASVSRSAFLTRQAAIIAWLYLFLNCTSYLAAGDSSRLSKPVYDLGYLHVSKEEWWTRIMTSLMFWFTFLRAAVDIDYRTASLLCVGIGLDSPEDWPPLFGRAKEAYTIRNFWGTYWHQMFRWPLTATSNYLARDLLALPRPSLLERYTNIFFVFLLSGVMHVMSDLFMGIPLSQSTSLFFFCSMPLGIMIEDAVQAAWSRLTDSRPPGRVSSVAIDGRSVPCWHKLVGFIWVCSWLSLTTPVWLYPMEASRGKSLFLLNIPELVGTPTAIAMTVGGSLVVKYVFGGEL